MDAATRKLVRQRAEDRCEYCGLAQHEIPFETLQVEHIRARQHGGIDDPSNLALSCRQCNLHKGPNLSAIDPETNELVTLFHPRSGAWHEHFEVEGTRIVGKSPNGRATARLLAMNTVERMELRASLEP